MTKFTLCFTIVLGLGAAVSIRAADRTNASLSLSQRLQRPKLQALHEARSRFARERIEPPLHGLYEDFPAAIARTQYDSGLKTNTSPAELLAAARKTGIQVILINDPPGGKNDSLQALRDGVLFLAVPDDATTNQQTSIQIAPVSAGEEFKEYITATLANSNRWQQLLKDFESYPDEFVAALKSDRREVLQNWDRETQKKHLTGVGANRSSEPGGGKVFDPYEVSFRHWVTHILATEKTEAAVRESLNRGRVYVAHDWLCNPAGFGFGAVNNLGVFGMGDTAPMLGKTRLSAIVPLTAMLRLIHNGTMIKETTGTNLTFEATATGVYRVEAWLEVAGEPRPWIYSNPVYLRGPTLADMKLPSMEISPEVEVTKDLVYREGPQEDAGKHKLDIYRPKGKSSSPVLFFVHGGAWRSGDRSYYPPLGNRYAREGFVTVIPSYRLAPKHKHPAQIEDVAAAFAWTARHIAEYGGDSNRIFAAGHSAGAHLAALLSLDKSHLAAYQLSPKHIRGVLAFSGVYNLAVVEAQSNVFGNEPEVRRAASPLFHINSAPPPFLVTYCEWDYFTLPAQARMFHRALKRAGASSELVYVAGENHLSEMINVTRAEDPTVAAAVKFMQRAN